MIIVKYAKAKENKKGQGISVPNIGKINTEKEIAEKAQVSHGNIYKVGLV
jgi:hypothetical protein